MGRLLDEEEKLKDQQEKLLEKEEENFQRLLEERADKNSKTFERKDLIRKITDAIAVKRIEREIESLRHVTVPA